MYEDWYGEHGAPGLIGDAVYGLPELHRERDRRRRPGREPGLLPDGGDPRAGAAGARGAARRRGDRRQVGRVSGAGREPTAGKHFVAVDETVTPYKVGRHRHTPEIEQELGDGVRVTFTPHLVPLAHGELVSCYVTPTRAEPTFAALYASAYARRAVGRGRGGPAGDAGGARDELLPHLGPRRRAHRAGVIVFATIDNLWKGTSSQAVQNLNLMFGRDEGEGL